MYQASSKMEIEIISSQCIKPSCLTPKHLKIHNLSLLDHFIPPIYIPMVLFYTGDQSTQAKIDGDITLQRLKRLKESLGESLTRFYPFAGRIKDKFSINCNDEGVYCKEVKASCSLLEFVNQPNFTSFIHKLVPGEARWEEAVEGHVAMIQVTCFACGGIGIGVLVSHMIADGAATSFFLNSWSATSRRDNIQYAFPNFDAPFPHNNDNNACTNNVMALCGQFLNKGRLAVRRFLFNAQAISKLKTQGCSLTVQNPTRVEVVSSLICKCAIAAFKAKSGLERSTLVTHAVNMRPRASPTFPESFMGNFVWTATALMSEKVIELPNMVTEMREAIKTINSDFVKSFEGKGGFVRYNQVLKEMVDITSNASMNYVHCTSWCNFGLYNIDFGWGKPTWVSCTTSSDAINTVFFNSVLLMDTPSRHGIEAWIYLNEDDMNILQQDKELLAFAVIDPNPLLYN